MKSHLKQPKKLSKWTLINPKSLFQPIEKVITPTPRRTSRVSHPPKRYSFLHDMQELHVHEESIYDDDPTTYEEALYDKDSLKWLEAMRIEMDSMYAN